MKTLKKTAYTIIFGLSLSFMTFDAKANENFEIIIADDAPVVRMEINTPTASVTDVYLVNANDRILLNEKVDRGETFESQIDFSDLRQGTYTLVSQVANMRYNKVLRVKNSKVTLVDAYYSYTPLFAQEGDLLTVYFIKDAAEDIGISIEDENYTYYDGYYNNGENIFSQEYSLENLRPGSYNLTFSSNGEFFTHEFEVQ